MLPKLTGKTIFTDGFIEIFPIDFLIHFSLGIYFKDSQLGNISRGINSREFNNPRLFHSLISTKRMFI